MARHILAIDQGTTSTRSIVFDAELNPVATDQREFTQHFSQSGWVEHDPEDLWTTTVETARAAIAKAGLTAADIAGIGITNQRETTVVWERETGKPAHNAIVWQDRRTAGTCAQLRADGHEPAVAARTGLLCDPYFSGTKLSWLLDQIPEGKARAARGELLFGTVDSFLIWRFSGGVRHVTDATNASRTMLYNIHDGAWDETLCVLLGVPMACLPQVLDCAGDFGVALAEHLGAAIPILGVAGDQQAATIGQACFQPGMLKSTYGTGCFAMVNTGTEAVPSKNRLLTTIAYQLDGQVTYALEGSIFVAGAVVQWLRDGLAIIDNAAAVNELAANGADGVYLVPAFTGLGAPYWDAECRGAIHGLTRATDRAALARAALMSVAYQTRDLWEAMRGDWPDAGAAVLRVDGGMTASDWTLQAIADQLQAPVDRPRNLETTAVGTAWLAGMRAGLYPDQTQIAASWAAERRFMPLQAAADADKAFVGWQDAVRRTLSR